MWITIKRSTNRAGHRTEVQWIPGASARINRKYAKRVQLLLLLHLRRASNPTQRTHAVRKHVTSRRGIMGGENSRDDNACGYECTHAGPALAARIYADMYARVCGFRPVLQCAGVWTSVYVGFWE